jgi:probable F420-dependent oxidoreductase
VPPLVPAGQLAVGLQLPVHAQSRIFAERWEHDAGVDEIVELACAADRLGFFYLGVCDHVAIPRGRAHAMGTTWYDLMTTLGFLAGITTRIRLLTHVMVLPARHPLQAAKAIATLDTLSRGRAILGVGAGHVPEELALAGTDFAARGRVLDESIDVLRAAMAEEFPAYDGDHVEVGDLGIAPRPVQAGGPPIWVGGSSSAALRRAGQRGDGWIPQGTPRADMPAQVARIMGHRVAAGIDAPLDLGAMAEPLYVGEPSWDIGRHSLAGSPAEHAERLRDYTDLGVTHVQVRFRSRSCAELLDQMAAFAGEVAPLLPA